MFPDERYEVPVNAGAGDWKSGVARLHSAAAVLAGGATMDLRRGAAIALLSAGVLVPTWLLILLPERQLSRHYLLLKPHAGIEAKEADSFGMPTPETREAWFEKVDALDLSGQPLDDELLEAVQRCSALRKLVLDDCHVPRAWTDWLARHKRFRLLSLGGARYPDGFVTIPGSYQDTADPLPPTAYWDFRENVDTAVPAWLPEEMVPVFTEAESSIVAWVQWEGGRVNVLAFTRCRSKAGAWIDALSWWTRDPRPPYYWRLFPGPGFRGRFGEYGTLAFAPRESQTIPSPDALKFLRAIFAAQDWSEGQPPLRGTVRVRAWEQAFGDLPAVWREETSPGVWSRIRDAARSGSTEYRAANLTPAWPLKR